MATAADIPKYEDFFQPVLIALSTMGGSGSNSELSDMVALQMALPPDLFEVLLKNNTPLVLNRIAWARTYLGIAGLLENPSRGLWVLTEEGQKALALDAKMLRRKVRDAAKRRDALLNNAAPASDPADASRERPRWSDQLLSILLAMKPDAFERLCQRILRESGFTKVNVTGRPNDGGIDGNGTLRMNLVSFQVIFQCKRWQGGVGPSVVRDFRGAMVGRADKGLIITTSSFSAEARKEATRDGAPVIDLVDGELLCELLRDLKLGVTTRLVPEFDVDRAFFATV